MKGKKYHHGDLRNRLIMAGLNMLCREGIASFSLRRLSKEIGVSHTAAYRHFRNRGELLTEIISESSGKFREALAASIKKDVSGEEALANLGIAYVRFYLDNPEIMQLFALLPYEEDPLGSLLFAEMNKNPGIKENCFHSRATKYNELPEDSAFGIFRSLVSAIKDQERYSHLSEKEILFGFWSKVHGLASLLIHHGNFFSGDDIDSVIERIINTEF